MSPEYVYVLSLYGEYGLEAPIIATQDREKLPGLLAAHFPSYVDETLPRLQAALNLSDEELSNSDGQTPLCDGLGGIQLLVVALS